MPLPALLRIAVDLSAVLLILSTVPLSMLLIVGARSYARSGDRGLAILCGLVGGVALVSALVVSVTILFGNAY